MEGDEFSFIDIGQYAPQGQVSGAVPSLGHQAGLVNLQQTRQRNTPALGGQQHLQQHPHNFPHPPQQQGPPHRALTSLSQVVPSKIGKRQTNRQKYTDEEVQRICSMKEAGMSWSKIAAHFPGRSQKSLQVSYCVNFKKRKERFEDEDKELLRTVLNEETAIMWERVSNRLGKSAESCRQKAKDLGLL